MRASERARRYRERDEEEDRQSQRSLVSVTGWSVAFTLAPPVLCAVGFGLAYYFDATALSWIAGILLVGFLLLWMRRVTSQDV